MHDELESEYNARWDDNHERWASEREDVRRMALADLAEETPEPQPRRRAKPVDVEKVRARLRRIRREPDHGS